MIDHRHGSQARVVDTERRSLRPIGIPAYEVARRTGELLAGLARRPGVRLYQGVQLAGHPPLPYALSAGAHVVLVDAVAWPPGSYATSVTGAVFCGGVYIGQSARPLLGAVRRMRRLQPRGHRVSAVVVIHPSAAGRLDLPAATGIEVTWAHAADAVEVICGRLRSGDARRISSRAVDALAAASGDIATG